MNTIEHIQIVGMTKHELNEMLEEVRKADAEPRLTILQRLMLKIGFKVYIGHRIHPSWKDSLPFYAWRCPDCGDLAIDYPHDYKKILQCPHCKAREEATKRTIKENEK